jgi:UDP-N-acetyl-D-galactosamine dehydrogenase
MIQYHKMNTGKILEMDNNNLKRGIFKELLQKQSKIAIVGANPMNYKYALELAQDFLVILFDADQEVINLIQKQVYSFEESSLNLHQNIQYTNDYEVLKTAKLFIIGASSSSISECSTSVQNLIKPTYQVAKVMKTKSLVVFESSVYPGCIEEVCIPLLKQVSGLRLNKHFKVGFAPARNSYNFGSSKKTVSGSDRSAINQLSKFYGHILKVPIEKAPTIRFTEILQSLIKPQVSLNEYVRSSA